MKHGSPSTERTFVPKLFCTPESPPNRTSHPSMAAPKQTIKAALRNSSSLLLGMTSSPARTVSWLQPPPTGGERVEGTVAGLHLKKSSYRSPGCLCGLT